MKVTSHSTLVVTKDKKPHEVPPGTPVEIDDEEALDLIERGLAVEAVKATAPEKPEKPEKTDPAKNNGGNGQKNGKQQ
jgi:hypothetical protein